MVAVAWTVVGLLAAAVLGMFAALFQLGGNLSSRIDGL
jgi:hypothetical protein